MVAGSVTRPGFLAILGCGACGGNTKHVHAYRVPGLVQKGEFAGDFRLKAAQEVEPVPEKHANAVELLFMCVQCGTLRRWGLEVPDAEARGVRVGAGVAGEQGGAGDGEKSRRQSLVPEESLEAWAERLGRRTRSGQAAGGA